MEKYHDARIIVIDDNPDIHQDFIKILTANNIPNNYDDNMKISQLDEKIFGKSANKAEYKSMDVNLDYQIDTALQGKEGVEYIAKAAKENSHYALAFVDVRMPPGWDGIETIQHIWEVDPNIQVVICTAYSDYTWEETVEKLGLSDNFLILKKPFDNVVVRQLSSALIKKWQLMQSSREHQANLEMKIDERTKDLKESVSLIKATMEASADGIVVIDRDGNLVNYNDNFKKMWQIPQSLIEKRQGNAIFQFLSEKIENSEDFLQSMIALQQDNDAVVLDTIALKDGRVFERHSQLQKLDKQTVGRIWSFRDMTHRVKLERDLEHKATHDTLTGLPNRALLHDRIQCAIATAERYHHKIAIMFIDLDRFKMINDSLGHEVGDVLLQEVSKRLSEDMRKEDTLARLGGDEFVLLFARVNSKADIEKASKRILAKFREPFIVSGRNINITASIGISYYPDDSHSFSDLLRNADLAMYQAKYGGTNNCKTYSEGMNQQMLANMEIEMELYSALENNEFIVYYQPQISSEDNRIISAEALLRWQHPKRGLLLPEEFIHTAEESSLIVLIGHWLLETVCQQMKKWQENGLPSIKVAINVSTLQLQDTEFISFIKQTLKKYNINEDLLEIEIKENVMIYDEQVIATVKQLTDAGISIALDDFGTGNSSLSYLRELGPKKIKIDRSFVQNISYKHNDEVIINSIIAIANSLGLEVVAEGIETEKQLEYLKSKKCESFQGFFFSEPLANEKFEQFLSSFD